MKQADSMRKSMSEDDEAFEAIWTTVKAYLCKQMATSLLNKLMLSQAFHNGIDFSVAFAPGKLTVVNEAPTIVTA